MLFLNLLDVFQDHVCKEMLGIAYDSIAFDGVNV